MKLSDVVYGMVITTAPHIHTDEGQNIGMVKGLAKNTTIGEIVLEVLWAGGNKLSKIHPANVEPYKEEEEPEQDKIRVIVVCSMGDGPQLFSHVSRVDKHVDKDRQHLSFEHLSQAEDEAEDAAIQSGAANVLCTFDEYDPAWEQLGEETINRLFAAR